MVNNWVKLAAKKYEMVDYIIIWYKLCWILKHSMTFFLTDEMLSVLAWWREYTYGFWWHHSHRNKLWRVGWLYSENSSVYQGNARWYKWTSLFGCTPLSVILYSKSRNKIEYKLFSSHSTTDDSFATNFSMIQYG